MFEFLYNFFAIIFGYVMNAFYIVLEAIGLPYLWLCIVLLAAVTRLMFLSQKISAERKTLLAPTINYEMRLLRNQYGSVSKKDKERLQQYQNDTKAIFKKYKVSTSTGCLASLIQFPILVGLFRVVKQPFDYVPQLSLLSETERLTVNDFFGLSLEALPQSFGAIGTIIPALILLSTLVPMLPNKNKKQPAVVTGMSFLVAGLLTWMSFCVPIAVSMYWFVKSVTNMLMTAIVKLVIKNNKKIKAISEETARLIEEEKAREELIKENEVANGSDTASEEDVINVLEHSEPFESVETQHELKDDTPFCVDEAFVGLKTYTPEAENQA